MRAAPILVVLAVAAAAAQPLTARPIAITGVTVIDPNVGAAVPGMTVVIRDKRIASVGAGMRVPRNATVVDGRRKFLIPGLWDMHVHLGYARESAFPAFVADGVTAVRDLGGDLAELDRWRKEVSGGSRVGPLIVRVGPMLQASAAGERDGPGLRFQVLIDTPEEGRAAVRRLHAAGVEAIKVRQGLSREVYFATAAEARALGLPLTGHIPMTVTPEEASDAGQSIEHMSAPFEGTFRATRRGTNPAPEMARWRSTADARALVQRFVRNGTSVAPTLVVMERMSNRIASGLPDPDWRYTAASARASADKGLGGVRYDAAPQARLQGDELGQWQAVARMMHDGGVKLLAGSDVGILSAPGFSLHDELELLVGAGLPPAAALRAATSTPAAMFPKLETGSITPGTRADLVLLDANPLIDIRNARRIHAVMLAGHLLDRAALDRLLAEALKLAAKN